MPKTVAIIAVAICLCAAAPVYAQDCNTNGVPDALDVAGATSSDCDFNQTPDECQADCDHDGTPDACEPDCNTNGAPDGCEPPGTDVNGNGVPDACDSSLEDCNSNGVHDPDEPDYDDCNTNQTFDACEPDCDGNGRPDDCDLADGGLDCDANGTLDACEAPPTVIVYYSDAIGWRAAAPDAAAVAFDQYFAGVANSLAVLTGPTTELNVGPQRISIEAVNGTAALIDGSTAPAVSDAALFPGQISRWRFKTPIRGFYCYYGSQGGSIQMTLYRGECALRTIVREPVGDWIYAHGVGFICTQPIDRIDFQTTELALIGAFVGLDAAEPSLGIVTLPGYPGPAGAQVQLDFAFSLPAAAGDLNCDGRIDAADVPFFVQALINPTASSGCDFSRADVNQDGLVDALDIEPFVVAVLAP